MSDDDLVEAVLGALAAGGCGRAEQAVGELAAALEEPLDDDAVREVLDALRREGCFLLMDLFARKAASHATMPLSVYVRRQRAQALLELRDLDEAREQVESVLRDLDADENEKERSEAVGLLGRMHKDLFVRAEAGSQAAADHLSASIALYASVFDLDPSWHGSNLVALVARAERDGIDVDTDSARVWGETLLATLKQQPKVNWRPWDFAAAAEASLALGDRDGVAKYLPKYWNSPSVSRFALAGTRRQLEEIWQLESGADGEFLSSLLTHLEARELAVAGGGKEYTVEELCRLAGEMQGASGTAEAVFGRDDAIPIERVLGLLDRAQVICRVTPQFDARKGGTGFLVDGAELATRLAGQIFVLTNHHVLCGEEMSDRLREHDDYRGVIDVAQAVARFHYWGGTNATETLKLGAVVAHSPSAELDFALASLEADITEARSIVLSSVAKPLKSRNFTKDRDRVFIVGHPEGQDSLSFSFSDNEVVDHELTDTATLKRRIHYRAPTSSGSSGSPVFHHESLEVIGLHRAGDAAPLRDDWPHQNPDEEYKANEAIAIRSIRDNLASG